jgi:hypothetical protein
MSSSGERRRQMTGQGERGIPTGQGRQAVLAALDQLECPAAHEDISPLLQAFWGTSVLPGEIGRLARDDREAFNQGIRRPVWICPALVGKDGGANYGLLTRSDWPLWERVMSPRSEQTRLLWLVRKFCDFVLIAEEEQDVGLDTLIDEATRRAAFLPAARLQEYSKLAETSAHESELVARIELWRAVAEDEYMTLARDDRALRHQLANRLERASLETRLFGSDS